MMDALSEMINYPGKNAALWWVISTYQISTGRGEQ
jgi:hypothetical protein